ncbi:bcl-2-like protein 11 [Hippoglossus stenolepis]|uniref:bcl-2-like protein 11 n=1 Tax=Hippoglossus stenolepis TaxID=195615 RepID=UPI00159C112E|nr:bcl-2-like protein 11 [Hippoglossus stenolepis]
MYPPTRPPNRSDGSPAVTATEESGGDPPRVGATGAPAQTSRSKNNNSSSSSDTGSSGGGGEPLSPARCRSSSSVDSLDVFQKRSIFTSPRRHSSGYFSFDSDSLPSTPLSPRPVTADRATQTPSPSGQAMNHALQRMAEAHGGGPGTRRLVGSSPSPSSMLQRDAAEEMQEEAVGQELRRIGDDYNRHLLLRGAAGGRRHVVIHPNQLPQVQQGPTLLLCMGLLLLVVGRLIYMQGSTNLQDHSQV